MKKFRVSAGMAALSGLIIASLALLTALVIAAAFYPANHGLIVGLGISCAIFLVTAVISAITAYRKKIARLSQTVVDITSKIQNGEVWQVASSKFKTDDYRIFSSVSYLSVYLNKREENRTRIMNMISDVTSSMEVEQLFEHLLPALAAGVDSNWGAFYLANNSLGKLELKASLGFAKNIYGEFDLSMNEGLFGGMAWETEIKIIKDMPHDTMFITKTFLGKIQPKNVMLTPINHNGVHIGVLALASIFDYTNEMIETVNMLRYYLGIALSNCLTFERTKRLTSELQFQNNLIQNLNAELEAAAGERAAFHKNVINSITDYAIFVVDPTGIIIEFNTGAQKLYGVSESDVVGKPVEILFSEEEAQSGRSKARLDMVIQNGFYSEQGWRTKKDGGVYYCDMSAFGIYNEKRELIAVTNISRDKTDYVVNENELWFLKGFTRRLIETYEEPVILTSGQFIIELVNDKIFELLDSDRIITGRSISTIFADPAAFEKFAAKRNATAKLELKASGKIVKVVSSWFINSTETYSEGEPTEIIEGIMFKLFLP